MYEYYNKYLPAAQRFWLLKAYSSACSRVISYILAKFSAVIPMGVFVGYWSTKVTAKESSNVKSKPKVVPHLTLLSLYGDLLILSAPPVRTMFESPERISCIALITVWKPDPHNLLRVKAGTWIGRPVRCPTCLARYGAVLSVWLTLPKIIESIGKFGGKVDSAPFAAKLPSSVAIIYFNYNRRKFIKGE